MAHPERSSVPASATSKLSLVSVLGNLGWPILLGSAVTSVFFILIYRGPLNLPVMHRYFASHPVTFAETGLFFIGLAALALKLLQVTGQYLVIGKVKLSPREAGEESPERAADLIAELDRLEPAAGRSVLARRLRDALESVRRNGSADHLNDELKYLADVDAVKQQDDYSLVRIVIWATPMLGFLGTVMGITQALGDLSANAELLATSIDTAIQGLLSGLYVAFDTTALALVLSMVLMFLQFMIDRAETQLYGAVDAQVGAELIGRFQSAGYSSDPQVATVERMAHAVVRSTEKLVERQAQLWHASIAAAQQEWERMFESAGRQVRQAVDGALAGSVEEHSAKLLRTEQTVLEQSKQGWEKLHGELQQQSQRAAAQSAELNRHGEVLLEVLRATGDVVKLEQSLNANLAALAGSKNFEETVMSLSAAIHLLTARLGRTEAPAVELTRVGSPIAGTIRPAAGTDRPASTAPAATNAPAENVAFASSWVSSGAASPEAANSAARDAKRQGKAA